MTPRTDPVVLRPHGLQLALVHPQIAPNTGNIGRLCVATGTHLHLVRPLGFVLSDQKLKRSAMDYWPRLQLTVHDDLDAFIAAMKDTRLWLFTSKATRSYWDADYAANDCLVLGSESAGLPESITQRFHDQTVRIPQAEGERCLNVSTAAGIGLYEALRHVTASGSET